MSSRRGRTAEFLGLGVVEVGMLGKIDGKVPTPPLFAYFRFKTALILRVRLRVL
jgi:hypothetical protein